MDARPSTEVEADQPSTSKERTVDFNDVFSLRRPKDAKAGLSSGLKSIAKGVVGGLAGLVAAPTIGAHQDGAMGFAKGLATGVVGAVVLPVTGVAVGVVQMVRGISNTPESFVQQNEGKIWDEDKREWVDKPDGSMVAASNLGADATNMFKKARSTGVDYYEVLGVTKEATPEQIKKAYYLQARKWHPDKNPDDAGAHEKFQKLGEAYQVLSNPELKARYDEHGSEGLDVNFMDGAAFFNMLFGNDMFDHLVGELMITAAARSGGNMTQVEMKRAQLIRIEKLAVNLKTTLKRYEAGDVEGFKIAMRSEGEALAKVSFGETLLHTIGRVYEMTATIHLGGFFGGFAAKMKFSGETIKTSYNAASAALKVYQAQQKIEQWQKAQEKKAMIEALADHEGRKAAAAAAKALETGEGGSDPAAVKDGVEEAKPPSSSTTGVANAGTTSAANAGTTGAAKAGTTSTAKAGTTASAANAGSTGAGTSSAGGKDAQGAGATAKADAGASSSGGPTKADGVTKEEDGDEDSFVYTHVASAGEIEERAKLEEDAMQMMLEAMWAANAMDIVNTLRKVCDKVLEDEKASKSALKDRAMGLKELGLIYQEAKAPVVASANPEENNARKRMEEAMMRVVEKRTGATHEEA